MQIVSKIGATSHTVNGSVYAPNPEGIFEVPDHVGVEMVHFSHWVELHVRLAELDAEQALKNADPTLFGERIAALERTVAELTKKAPAKSQTKPPLKRTPRP